MTKTQATKFIKQMKDQDKEHSGGVDMMSDPDMGYTRKTINGEVFVIATDHRSETATVYRTEDTWMSYWDGDDWTVSTVEVIGKSNDWVHIDILFPYKRIYVSGHLKLEAPKEAKYAIIGHGSELMGWYRTASEADRSVDALNRQV